MRLVKPTMLDLLKLANKARPDEVEQYEAIFGKPWQVDEIAAWHYARTGIKFSLLDEGGEPIAAGGYDQVSPGVWHDWLLGTPENWASHWRSITKASRFVMDQLFADGAVRLQTAALESRALACHWYVKGLKMQYVGTVPGYAANGENVVLYERLRPEVTNGR